MPSRTRRLVRRLRSYRLPVFAYGFVSFCLLLMGCVFSGFAIFERKSVISKIWLAGPTTMAVGLVLCGKVIIDCRPGRNEEDEEEEENLTQYDNWQKNRYDDQQQLDKVRDSLISISKIRGHTSVRNDVEDKCPDYESSVWNMRDDVSGCDNIDDNSLCLCNTYASHAYVDEDLCPLCIVAKQEAQQKHRQENHSDNVDRVDNNVEMKYLLSNTPSPSPFKMSATNTTPTHCDSLSTQHKSNQTENLSSSAAQSSSSHSPLYQGEIFLYNDRQYLI